MCYDPDVKRIAASKFKQTCLDLLDHIDADGVVITKRGKPVAKLLSIERAYGDLIGALKGRIRIRGDIVSTGVRWHAES